MYTVAEHRDNTLYAGPAYDIAEKQCANNRMNTALPCVVPRITGGVPMWCLLFDFGSRRDYYITVALVPRCVSQTVIVRGITCCTAVPNVLPKLIKGNRTEIEAKARSTDAHNQSNSHR